MTSKEIFLAINKEILLKTNNQLSFSSKEEERILNYRNGIRITIKSESQLREVQFFTRLQEMYLKTHIPLFNSHTTLLLYRKFLTNKEIFKSVCYLATKLKNKPFVKELPFWELVMDNFNFIDKGSFVLEKLKLDLFIQISSKLFVIFSYEFFQLIFRYTLNHSKETVKLCWSMREIGTSPSYLISESPLSPSIWKTYRFLHEMNAPHQVYEVIFFQNSLNYAGNECLLTDEYHSFFQFLYRLVPITTIQRESIYSNISLFKIYELNPKLFKLIDFQQVNEEYLKILNASPWSSSRLGEFSSFLVGKMLKAYKLSVYFAEAYAAGSINRNEREWLYDAILGKNLIHSANLPFKLTHKVATEFNQQGYIPGHGQSVITVTEALVRTALFIENQDMAFAQVIYAKIRNFSESNFWIKTMGLLYRKGLRADTIELNGLYDYIHFQVFQLGRNIDFTTKKLSNLVDESNQWHIDVSNENFRKRLRMKRLPDFNIKPFFLARNDSRYVIKQLMTNIELAIEGDHMKHCVYSYTYDCLNSGSYIFSLKNLIKNTDTKKYTEITMITIEVNNNRIKQKLGEFNRKCNQLEDDLIAEWAKEHNLTL